MAKKQVVLLIVEGSSDERVLVTIVRHLNQVNSAIQFELVHGDSFTQPGRLKGKAVVKQIIDQFVARSKIPPKQIMFVGYLVDVDGAYLPASDMQCHLGAVPTLFEYDLSACRVIFGSIAKQQSVQAKWAKKRARLNELQSLNFKLTMTAHAGTRKSVQIPVQIYFNNLTLEHVLANELLRGAVFEARKRAIVRAFVTQLEQQTSPYVAAESFFAARKPANLKDNQSAWQYIRATPWSRCSSIYFLLQTLEQLVTMNNK